MSGKVIKVLGRFKKCVLASDSHEHGAGDVERPAPPAGTAGRGPTYGTYASRATSSYTKHTDPNQINTSSTLTRKGQIAGEVYVPYVEGSPAVHMPNAPREAYVPYVDGDPALNVPDAGAEAYVPYVEGAPAPNIPNVVREAYVPYVGSKERSEPVGGGALNVTGPTPLRPSFSAERLGFLTGYYCSRPRGERLAMHQRGQDLRRQHPGWPGDACDLRAMDEHLARHPAQPPFEVARYGSAGRYLKEVDQ